MNEDILDKKEKHLGLRTCPECGHQFPFGRFVKRYLMLYIMSYGPSKWTCHSCRVLIKCDFIKVQIMWLIGFLILVAILGVLSSHFGLGLLSIIFFLFYFAFVLLTLFYVRFEKYE